MTDDDVAPPRSEAPGSKFGDGRPDWLRQVHDLYDRQAITDSSDPRGYRGRERHVLDGLIEAALCNNEHHERDPAGSDVLLICRLLKDHDGDHRGSAGVDRPGWTMTWRTISEATDGA